MLSLLDPGFPADGPQRTDREGPESPFAGAGGRELPHSTGYETEGAAPWDSPTRFQVSDEIKRTQQPVQSRLYLYGGDTRQYFVNDFDSPYTTPKNKDFRWYRGNHQGGRSLQWARQVYRLSEMDFKANKKDGHGTDWPIRYADLAPLV